MKKNWRRRRKRRKEMEGCGIEEDRSARVDGWMDGWIDGGRKRGSHF